VTSHLIYMCPIGDGTDALEANTDMDPWSVRRG